ncbi:hypothetical protein OCH239_04300 [Roseivivax halodurans JCM 10272]|uniref:Uncharacterized protein n=1 Tax=Roseivivax halodurans JCM 10272 TaxID=1449350 RepID=X7EEF9_9RHOB|nr:hypothetical protein OCH239_04300 [Roseivivax halodurans JCM 10272]
MAIAFLFWRVGQKLFRGLNIRLSFSIPNAPADDAAQAGHLHIARLNINNFTVSEFLFKFVEE